MSTSTWIDGRVRFSHTQIVGHHCWVKNVVLSSSICGRLRRTNCRRRGRAASPISGMHCAGATRAYKTELFLRHTRQATKEQLLPWLGLIRARSKITTATACTSQWRVTTTLSHESPLLQKYMTRNTALLGWGFIRLLKQSDFWYPGASTHQIAAAPITKGSKTSLISRRRNNCRQRGRADISYFWTSASNYTHD
jgi:hypothetical protein